MSFSTVFQQVTLFPFLKYHIVESEITSEE
jgi:hypothetical protein